ncbi:MAG: DNA-formamidopyrimidine glycosylase family protein [Woeseiaceae bacterium]|jgi:endonuclease-8|nr:DNA-formamidopyrimidine glycosylase family protein [Woeseiaceae bacterium]
MPEGDTIHKIAAFMAPRLTGQTVDKIRLGANAPGRFAGATIRSIEARGKHLWLDLDNDSSIRTHLGMYGSWHVYKHSERWRKPARQASLVLESGDERYVCFNARDVEIVDRPGVRERVLDARLGPDLIATVVDPARLLARAREFDTGDTLLIDTLLDQRVAAGIGNVYKSEVLFLHRLPPDRALAATPDETIAGCFLTAADLLRRNLGGGKRTTRFAGDMAGRLWVYGRTGQLCHECDTPIRQRRMGRHHRGTYWCPRCQA